MNRLDGKVALLSGAARGIGGQTARRMAEAGAKIVIGDVLEEPGKALAQEITDAGGDARRERKHEPLQRQLPPADIVPLPLLETDLVIGSEMCEAERLVQPDARRIGLRDTGEGGVIVLSRQIGQQFSVEAATDTEAL